MTAALEVIAGLLLLVVGGELLVRGSVRLAERLGVSALLIGLVLVGFGTSTPELVTSVQAAIVGSPGIAVGNIVGSNLANILLILGAAALICPLVVQARALKRDGGIVLASTLVFAGVALTVGLSRPVGIVFVMLLVAYLAYVYAEERGVPTGHSAAFDKAQALGGVDVSIRPQGAGGSSDGWARPLLIALVGLVVIVVGGRVLVGGAVSLARMLGVTEEVIGLTIVAVGTSMPELVTSLVAAARRQAEVAIGNVLGSNLYNVLGIGGLTALIAPTAVPAKIARIDLPVLISVTALLLYFAWTGRRLNRLEGGVFLGLYAVFLAYQIVR